MLTNYHQISCNISSVIAVKRRSKFVFRAFAVSCFIFHIKNSLKIVYFLNIYHYTEIQTFPAFSAASVIVTSEVHAVVKLVILRVRIKTF
jgi:hypothetical protein